MAVDLRIYIAEFTLSFFSEVFYVSSNTSVCEYMYDSTCIICRYLQRLEGDISSLITRLTSGYELPDVSAKNQAQVLGRSSKNS